MEVHREQRRDGDFDERTRNGAASAYEYNQKWYEYHVKIAGRHDGTEMVPQKSLIMFLAVRRKKKCQPNP